MKKIVYSFSTLALVLAIAGCGGGSDSIKYPIQYRGTFTEQYTVTATWGLREACVERTEEEGVLVLEEDGTAQFQHPKRTLNFKHNANGQCEYVTVDTTGGTTTSGGVHDSRASLEVSFETSAGTHQRTYKGTFTKSVAEFTGDYVGEDSIGAWRWNVSISGSFSGSAG